MAGLGSWVRFIVGMILAGEVLRNWISGGMLSIYAGGLAVLLLGLSVLYFVFRF